MMSDNSTILEGLPSALIVVLVCLVVAAGLWFLAIRFRQPRLKVFAVVIAAFPIVGFGLNVASHVFGWSDPPDFETTATATGGLDGSMISEFPFPVPNPGFVHQIELTPRSQSGQNATGSVALDFIVPTPRVKSTSKKGSASFQFKRNGEANVKLPPPSTPLSKDFEDAWEGTLDAPADRSAQF